MIRFDTMTSSLARGAAHAVEELAPQVDHLASSSTWALDDATELLRRSRVFYDQGPHTAEAIVAEFSSLGRAETYAAMLHWNIGHHASSALEAIDAIEAPIAAQGLQHVPLAEAVSAARTATLQLQDAHAAVLASPFDHLRYWNLQNAAQDARSAADRVREARHVLPAYLDGVADALEALGR